MSMERETFGAAELAVCLSHYDLGILESVREFPRGSRRSPKAVILSEKGKFLFKRRARGKDDAQKVAFTHQLQLHLAAQNFPLPHLVGAKPDNNSLLMWNGRIYELFEFIDAGIYDGSLEATADAGRILGLYHKLLLDFVNDYTPPRGSYHDAKAISTAIRNTINSLPTEGRPSPDELMQTVSFLEKAYSQCCQQADQLGLKGWPAQIVHGDWHPGNMLFRDRRIAAVIDYDSARLYQRVIDLANGALQFSILGGGDDPAQWPEQVDQTRLKRFIRGYDAVHVISKSEIQVIPLLMCEAMIAESVLPIAATGSFGRMEGFPFLQMIHRKVNWILANLADIQMMLMD